MIFNTAPTSVNLGWLLAFIILILDVVLKMVGLIDFPIAMVVAALCAIRL